jgi:ubiquinone/menaquinone biosynthesis C-methylase UbiE
VRRLAKLCDVRDFDDADVLRVLREILPERDPLAHVERKVWEFAMLALFLEETGRLHDGTSALAVGAGDERMVFWLANRVGRVVATDIYGEGSFAEREATATMLTDPASHAPFPYREDHLEVLYADARELPFADGSFDVVFSLSSIEHFGGPRDVARAAAEMGRVLKPGGHAMVATECFVRLDPRETALADSLVRALTLNRKRKGATPRRRLIEGFTARELRTRIVAPSGLELVQPLDLSLSPESWRNLTVTHGDGRLEPATGDFYPHVLLKAGRSVFTSVCLPLRKAPAAA